MAIYLGGETAVEPAKPASILPSEMRRTLRAFPLMTVSPSVTWPSPAIAILPSRLTRRTVVERSFGIFPTLFSSRFIKTQ